LVFSSLDGLLKPKLGSGILIPIMPAIQRSEFALALNQVAAERGVDASVVLDTVKNAILAAYRKDHPGIEVEEYTATLNQNTGEARIFHNEEDVTPPGFGRIAAQTAKQVILQKIREKEKEAIVTDYRAKLGTIVNGMVLKFLGPNVVVDIGKTEAMMPPAEQIPVEKYHLNQRLTVYILDIREGLKGEEIVVSRANNGLIEGLFKREVPEVAQGAVVIKAIAREPGNRSKVAVISNQSGIDPVGSCVGQKGVRVQAIIDEFNGLEKIDIIQWQDNPKQYIAASLSPAKEVTVEVDEEQKIAHVKVPSAQLSLAIGKEGQNVRLASKLTGYRIEIEGEGEPEAEVSKEGPKEAQKPAEEVQTKEEVKAEEPAEAEEQKDEANVQKEASDQPSDAPVAQAADDKAQNTDSDETIDQIKKDEAVEEKEESQSQEQS